MYDIGKAEHHFNEMEKQAESLRLLAGSVLPRSIHSSLFIDVRARVKFSFDQ